MSKKPLTGDRLHDDPLPTLLAGVISAGTLLVGFSLMAVGVDDFWVAFPVGFGVVLPTAVGLASYAHTERRADTVTETRTRTGNDEDAALETLRARYARGDLTETEFERRVERLLETELHGDRRGPPPADRD